MGALARLSGPAAEVQPGGRTSLELSVRNTGTVVDQFSFEVLGAAAPWTTVEPPTISLFPQAEETVHVEFAPPRAPGTAAGAVPFGVRVVSREDPAGSVVEEGTVTVTPFSDVVAELTPRATRVRSRGRVQVLVDNRSNVAFRAELAGTDTDEAFYYIFQPPFVDVAPGTVNFTKLTIRAKARYWRGPATTTPVQVFLRQPQVPVAEGEEAPPPSGPHPAEIPTDGAVLREALLPGWLPKALAALVALILLLALAWYKLLKPQITAAAQNSVAKAIKPIEKQIGTIQHALPPTTAGGGQGGGGTTTTTSPPATTTSTTAASKATTSTTSVTTKPKPTTAPTVVTPINQSITSRGNNTVAVFAVPEHHTLQVTDILLENSAGVSGNIYLERNGVVLMSWAMANFRDLDYHWITPIYFASGTQLQLAVRDCAGVCTPSLYFAGSLVSSH
ncbi:MAG TPA: hypothetical protein VME46_02505 [Acidimicrobiales bacterium]|nr:hypothetical protein [Acidimicrobiales bacterium]